MTEAEFAERTKGVRCPAGTVYFVDHNDRTVYSVVTWLHGERWFAEYVQPRDRKWREEYEAAVHPSRAAMTFHFPKSSR